MVEMLYIISPFPLRYSYRLRWASFSGHPLSRSYMSGISTLSLNLAASTRGVRPLIISAGDSRESSNPLERSLAMILMDWIESPPKAKKSSSIPIRLTLRTSENMSQRAFSLSLRGGAYLDVLIMLMVGGGNALRSTLQFTVNGMLGMFTTYDGTM